MDFDQITEQLFVGGAIDAGDWHTLAALGISVDISLQGEAQDRFTNPRPEIYIWLPTPDWFGPGVEAIEAGAVLIDTLIRQGRKVYVHCRHGAGRAPIAASGYLVTQGMAPGEAMAVVKVKRPGFKPNRDQIGQLHTFAAAWQARTGQVTVDPGGG